VNSSGQKSSPLYDNRVRGALGAPERQVVRMLLQDSLQPVLIGLGLGLFASLLGGTVVESVLLGVSSRDPLSIVSAALVLFGAAAFAVMIPARRAAAVEPARLLKLG
jgi:putative ABC transport system permease protein